MLDRLKFKLNHENPSIQDAFKSDRHGWCQFGLRNAVSGSMLWRPGPSYQVIPSSTPRQTFTGRAQLWHAQTEMYQEYTDGHRYTQYSLVFEFRPFIDRQVHSNNTDKDAAADNGQRWWNRWHLFCVNAWSKVGVCRHSGDSYSGSAAILHISAEADSVSWYWYGYNHERPSS